MSTTLQAVQLALSTKDPADKCAAVKAIGPLDDSLIDEVRVAADVGRPTRPQLISPRDVPVRGLGTESGRAALIHAVAHIEFNAINLALDACARFAGMPAQFYADWISVARDESRHFQMLRERLQQLGCDYGDLPAHNGLWEAAEKTAHDVLARMALVPRVLEARGLDVTPGMIRRLTEVRDVQTTAILHVILDEEVRHVAIGTHWYRWLCTQRGLDASSHFTQLLTEYGMQIRPPINWPARQAAGFNLLELPDSLRQLQESFI